MKRQIEEDTDDISALRNGRLRKRVLINNC